MKENKILFGITNLILVIGATGDNTARTIVCLTGIGILTTLMFVANMEE